MAECHVYEAELPDLATPDALKRAERLDNIVHDIKANTDQGKLLRHALGFDIDLGGNIDYDIRAWMMYQTGVDLGKGPSFVDGDLALMEAKIGSIKDMTGRMEKLGSETGLKTLLKKFWYLPHEQFRRNVIGGKDLWERTTHLEARKNDRLENMMQSMDQLQSTLDDVFGIDSAAAAKEISKYETRSMKASSARQAIEASMARGEKKHTETDMQNALAEERAASAELRMFRTGMTGKTEAGQLISDLVDAIQGKYGKPEFAHNFLIKKWDKIQVRRGRVKEAITQVTKFLDHYGHLADNATRSAQRNFELELIHMKGVKPSEARKLAEEMWQFTKEDNYFPRQHLLTAKRIEAAMNDIRQLTTLESITKFVQNFTSQHVKERTAEFPGDISKNMTEVLRAYSADIIMMDYHNSVAGEANEWTARLLGLRTKLSAKDYHAYIDGAINEVMGHAHNMLHGPQGGVANNVLRTLITMKAAGAMGFLNLNTPLVNKLEGTTHAYLRAGITRINEVRKLRDHYDTEIKTLLEGEYTRMTVNNLLGYDPQPTNYNALKHIFTAAELKKFYDIDLDTADRLSGKVADVTGQVATKALTLQRMAENSNRQNSFEIGIASEYDFIRARFKALFDAGDVPAWILKKHDIDPGSLNTREGRTVAWNKFAKDRTSRAGYDFMYQTQWNYNWAARHFVERWNPGGVPVGRALMMFQHFPLNWIAMYRTTVEQMGTVFKHAGVREAFKPTSRDMTADDRILGLKASGINHEMLYYMSVGAAHAVNWATKYFAPVTMAMLFSHPITETFDSLYEYFTTDDEDKRNAFWNGGMANQLLGPHYTVFTEHVMPAIGLAITNFWYDTGDLPEYFHELMGAGTGIDWTPANLEEKADRGAYGYTWDMLREVFLWDSLSFYPKYKRVAEDIFVNKDVGRLGWNLAKLLGVQPNWDVRGPLAPVMRGQRGKTQRRLDPADIFRT